MDDSLQSTTNEIMHIVNTTKSHITRFKMQIENKEVVVCLGNTRSGKSTLVNYIQGNELEAFEDTKRRYIKQKSTRRNGPGISHGPVSCTKLPSVWEMNDLDAVIVDVPGFEDNRGIAQDIVNTLFFNQLKHARAVSFVLVCDINDIDSDNVQAFTKAITKMQTIIADFNELKDAVSVIFTKDCKNYKLEEIATMLKQKILNVPEMQVKKDLVYHIIKNVKLIGIFKMPEHIGIINKEEVDCNVEGAITNNHPIVINATNIKFTPSEQARHNLLEIYQKFIFDMNYVDETKKIVRRFEKYFTVDKYVFASTEVELGQTKTRLQFALPSITTEKAKSYSAIAEISSSLLNIASIVSAEFESKLNFLKFMDECSLLNENIKQIVITKYKQALTHVEEQINKLIEKIDAEIEGRRRETIQYIVSEVASDRTKLVLMGTGLIPVAKKALTVIGVAMPESFAFEIVQFSAAGCGLVGAAGVGVAAGGYAVHYYKTIRLRQKFRMEQERT